jgi:hypothetical protein
VLLLKFCRRCGMVSCEFGYHFQIHPAGSTELLLGCGRFSAGRAMHKAVFGFWFRVFVTRS